MEWDFNITRILDEKKYLEKEIRLMESYVESVKAAKYPFGFEDVKEHNIAQAMETIDYLKKRLDKFNNIPTDDLG